MLKGALCKENQQQKVPFSQQSSNPMYYPLGLETAKEMQLQFEEQDREKEAKIQELTQENKQLKKLAEHAAM